MNSIQKKGNYLDKQRPKYLDLMVMKNSPQQKIRTHLIQNDYSSKILKNIFRPFQPNNITKIVSFHMGRCGSTVVGRMLNNHPEG